MPTWNSIYFMRADGISFGTFGYTGSATHVGYRIPISIPNDDTDTLYHLTYILVLYPVAAGLSGLAVLFGMCGAGYHRFGTIMMTLTAVLAGLCTTIAWVASTSLFGVARHKLNDAGIDAAWGNATWIALGALVALFLGFCTGLCGTFGNYNYKRRVRY